MAIGYLCPPRHSLTYEECRKNNLRALAYFALSFKEEEGSYPASVQSLAQKYPQLESSLQPLSEKDRPKLEFYETGDRENGLVSENASVLHSDHYYLFYLERKTNKLVLRRFADTAQ